MPTWIPDGFHTATPYIIVPDIARAIDFYRQAFSALELNRYIDSQGVIRNFELKIGDSPIMVSGHAEVKNNCGQSLRDLPHLSIYLYVPNMDALFEQAIAAGAQELYPPTNQDYGNREGGLADPFGNIWWVASRI